MATLYEIEQEYKELLDEMQSAEVDEETIQDTIEATGLKDDFENKIDGYLYVIDEAGASNKRIGDEEKRLAERRKTQEKNIRKMKEALLDTMKLLDIPKVRTDKYTIWYQNNPEKINIIDETAIPKEFYVEQEPKLDRNALKKAVKENDIPGVELQQTQGVRYR